MMADLPISLLPYVGNTGYTNNDLLVFVNYTIPSGTTSNTTLIQHKNWILSGISDYYVTASHPASFTKRIAFLIASSSDTSYDP